MLLVSGLIHDPLELVLTSLSDLILNDIYKKLELSKAVAKKLFEFFLYKVPSSGAVHLPLIILPLI